MIDLIREKGQVLIICTNSHLTKKGGIVKHYKTYVFNKENTCLYDIAYIMQNMGFKINKEHEVLICYAGNHKDMVREKLSKNLNKDIQVITDE